MLSMYFNGNKYYFSMGFYSFSPMGSVSGIHPYFIVTALYFQKSIAAGQLIEFNDQILIQNVNFLPEIITYF